MRHDGCFGQSDECGNEKRTDTIYIFQREFSYDLNMMSEEIQNDDLFLA